MKPSSQSRRASVPKVTPAKQGLSKSKATPGPKTTPSVEISTPAQENGDLGEDLAEDDGTPATGKSSKKVGRYPPGSLTAIFPEGYTAVGNNFHCPVDICDKSYTRRYTLAWHLNVSCSILCVFGFI